MRSGIKVFAPASIANVACGYDILGFALDSPGDEIIGRLSDKPGLRIIRISGIKHKIPFEVVNNTAGFAALKVLEHLDAPDVGIEMEMGQPVHLRPPDASEDRRVDGGAEAGSKVGPLTLTAWMQ